MIIWGSRARATAVGSGTFHCPGCASTQPYTHQKVRRWFTLYFIPLFPMGDLGEHVDCGRCRKSWRVEVLRARLAPPPQEVLRDEVRRAAMRSMAMVILANGREDPSEIDAASRAFQKAVGMSLPDAELTRELKQIRGDNTDLVRYLTNFGPQLTAAQKEALVVAACEVALYDGPIQPVEREAIQKVAKALGLTETHLRGILASVGDSGAQA
jgi:uncharacterized tellurite resistance protein B-like protein